MLNAALLMTTLNSTSRVNLAPFVILLLKESKFPTFCSFLVYHNLYSGWLTCDSNYLSLFYIHFKSTAYFSLNQSLNYALKYSPSLIRCKKSSAYFTVRATFPPI